MRSLDSLAEEVVIDSPERQESVLISNSNNGENLYTVEVKHIMERLNTAQVKVKKLQRLQAALVDFFMEVMDRSTKTSGSIENESAFARSKRKEQFLKKADGDPISLLNALRTHLRLQFAEQEAQQAADKRRVIAENLSNQQKEEQSREKFQQLELTSRQLKEQQNSLIQQINQNEVNQGRIRRQHQTLLDKLSFQIQEERSREQAAQKIIVKQKQEITALEEARDALIKSAQNQKSLDGARSQNTTTATATPAQASGSPSHTNSDVFGTPAEYQTLRRALRKYESKMAQSEAANEERKREVQRLQQQLTGLRQSTQLQIYTRLEKESRHTRELADDLKHRLTESEADLLRTKGTLKERECQVQKMKEEYAKLFTAVQKQKQPMHYSPSKLARTGSAKQLSTSQQNHSPRQSRRFSGVIEVADNGESTTPTHSEHPYVVEYYRSEAKRVERESEALKLQIRRMMASEQLHKQKTRVLRAEKLKLTQERDQLRGDLTRTKKHNALQNIAMDRQQSQSSGMRKVGSTNALHDVKHLQERNAFLEERFRKSLQSNSIMSSSGAVARLRSIPSGMDGSNPPEHESETKVAKADCPDPHIPSQNSAIFSKTRPSSAQVSVKKDNENSFRSLDAATLQSLQQVKKITRVRPRSANPIK